MPSSTARSAKMQSLWKPTSTHRAGLEDYKVLSSPEDVQQWLPQVKNALIFTEFQPATAMGRPAQDEWYWPSPQRPGQLQAPREADVPQHRPNCLTLQWAIP